MRHAILVAALFAAPAWAADDTQAGVKFGCEVFALEGGPGVVVITLTNVTDAEITLMGWSDEAILAYPVQNVWSNKAVIGFDVGSDRLGMRFDTLKPRATVRKVLPLHHEYEVATGPCDIDIRAKFREKESSEAERTRVVADFSRTLTVTPPANTKAAAEQLIERLTEYAATLPAADRAGFLCQSVLNTAVPEFLPLALRLTREADWDDARQLIEWIIETQPAAEFWRAFAAGVTADAPYPSVWLECARGYAYANPDKVGEPQYKLMRASPNLVARLAAASYFPKCFSDAEYAALLAAAAKWKPPVTAADIEAPVALLAAGSFRQREAASRQLRKLGPQGVAPLTTALAAAADAEVRARLTAVIQQCQAVPPDEGDEHFIRQLAWQVYRPKAAAEILAALAKNDPAAPVTKLAERGRESLAEGVRRHAKESGR